MGLAQLSVLGRILDRLEEWIIASLIGAATALTFVAVVHRYGASNSASLAAGLTARLCSCLARGRLGLPHARRDQPLLGAGACHLHVRVDGEVRRRARRAHRHPCRRRRPRRAADARGAQAGDRVRAAVRRLFTGVIGTLGAIYVHELDPDQVSPELEWPSWIIYLCIPLGSYLMCFRFLQVMWRYLRTGRVPHQRSRHGL